MKDAWLTLLVEALSIHEVTERLCDFGFEVVKVPSSLPEGSFQVKCNICERSLQAQAYEVDSSTDSDGRKIIESCIVDVVEAGALSGSEIVLQHLKETVAVIQSSTTSDLQCDCDFRFHQAIASGDFLWYVDGRGFADDVETYLELS